MFRNKVAKMVSWCIAVLLRAHNQLYLEWAGLLQSVTASEEGVGLVELHSQLLQEACHQLTQLSVVPSWLGSHVIKSPVGTTSQSLAVMSPTDSYSSTTLPVRGSSKRNKSTNDFIDGEEQTTVKVRSALVYLIVLVLILPVQLHRIGIEACCTSLSTLYTNISNKQANTMTFSFNFSLCGFTTNGVRNVKVLQLNKTISY